MAARFAAFAIATLLWAGSGLADDGTAAREKLANGLVVLHSRDDAAAEAAACVGVRAGWHHELRGEEGSAAGVARALLPPGARWQLITDGDSTRFCASAAPAELVPMVKLLAARLQPTTPPVVLRDPLAKQLVSQATTPTKLTELVRSKLRALAHLGQPPFGREVTTWSSALAPELLAGFHRHWYTPRNAAVSVTGLYSARDLASVRAELSKLAGRAPASLVLPQTLPRQTSERFLTIRDASSKDSFAYYGWAIGPAGTAEHRAMTLIAAALASGPSSIMQRVMIKQRDMVRSVAAVAERAQHGNLMLLEFELTSNVTPDRLQTVVSEIVRRVRTAGLTARELEYARAELVRQQETALASPASRARLLVEDEFTYGTSFAEEQTRLAGVSLDDIRRTAARMLTDQRQNLILVGPPPAPAAARNRASNRKPVAFVHVVKAGDTLSGLSHRYGVTVEEIRRANQLTPRSPIIVRQRLTIPRKP
jgi:predicted Zn-dependent peptidase